MRSRSSATSKIGLTALSPPSSSTLDNILGETLFCPALSYLVFFGPSMPTRIRKKRPFTRTTKGCLTCRSRHIKCDETYLRRGRERPSPCLNCQRVNRDCVRRAVERLIVYSSVADNGLSDASDENAGSDNECEDGTIMGGQSQHSNELNANGNSREVANLRSTAEDELQLSESGNPSPSAQSRACETVVPGHELDVSESQGTDNPRSHQSDENGSLIGATRHLSNTTGLLSETRSSKGAYEGAFEGYNYPSLDSTHSSTSHAQVPQTRTGNYCNSTAVFSLTPSPSLLNDSFCTSLPEECLNGTLTRLDPNDPEVFRCLHHYVTQIGPWNDLWDDQQRFSRLLPREAPSCQPLLAACVAMGAKHLSLTSTYDHDRVIRLYNHAIHRLMPVLQAASNHACSTPGAPRYTDGQIMATLLIMAQYEMCSHSNRTFRDHLNGASRYINHHNLRPGSKAGLLEAAFITYARCKGLSLSRVSTI